MCRALKGMQPDLNPSLIVTDFEKAALKAFSSVFPGSEQHGCFFHFAQAIFRRIQRLGLQHRYETDADFALNLRHLSALAFVPLPDVEKAYTTLINEDIIPPEAEELLTYFEDTWIGRKTRQGRCPPSFPPDLWNCYHSVMNDEPRTNNCVEGWHRGFESLTYGQHEDLWKTIRNFHVSQNKMAVTAEQYTAGACPPTKKKKYQDVDRRLRRLLEDYNTDSNIGEFLRGVAHNMSY